MGHFVGSSFQQRKKTKPGDFRAEDGICRLQGLSTVMWLFLFLSSAFCCLRLGERHDYAMLAGENPLLPFYWKSQKGLRDDDDGDYEYYYDDWHQPPPPDDVGGINSSRQPTNEPPQTITGQISMEMHTFTSTRICSCNILLQLLQLDPRQLG